LGPVEKKRDGVDMWECEKSRSKTENRTKRIEWLITTLLKVVGAFLFPVEGRREKKNV
jgi:hypothetical protein